MVKGKQKETKKKPSTAQSNAKKSSSDTKKANSIFDSLGSSTSEIVKKAASILEDEIAKGVVAARQVEDAFQKMSKTDKDQPYEILQRFRKDAHDILDIVLDMVTSSVGLVTNMSTLTAAMEKWSGDGKVVKSGSDFETAQVTAGPAKKGTTVQGSFDLNGVDQKTDTSININSTDLVGNTGKRIDQRNITFSPGKVLIRSGKPKKITFSITIPIKCVPGTYTGIVQFSNEKIRPQIISCVVV